MHSFCTQCIDLVTLLEYTYFRHTKDSSCGKTLNSLPRNNVKHTFSNKSLAMRGPETFLVPSPRVHRQLSLLNNSAEYINQGDFYGN